jgi:antitoxin (DNA-binding transcriptional repressor) of toxin-antitoxin stability system
MKPLTARELKKSTGEVVRALRRGESILLTFRGKPLGTIEPIRAEAGDRPSIPPYEDAWAEIETQLCRSKPRFRSWREAENESRGRK